MRNWKSLVGVLLLTILLLIGLALMNGAEAFADSNSAIGEAEITTTTPELPQGETEGAQPIEDHTWGGDPDDEDVLISGWVSWWWYVMNILYYYCCEEM